MADQALTPLGVALARLAEADPGLPAITDKGRTVTRLELEQRTNRLARAYAALGVRPGDMVTVGLPNGIGFYEAAIAAWKLGATPQPLSAQLPAHERRAIIDLADPALVVGLDPGEVTNRAAVPAEFEPDQCASVEPLAPIVPPSLKAPASGGSTGRPKLIVSTQPGALETVAPFAGLLRMRPGGVHLVTGPLFHNGPFLASICALFTGSHIVVMTRFDASHALKLVERHRVSWMYAVPTMMLRIWRLPPAERDRFDLSSLEVVLHLAAPCPAWLKDVWIDWLGPDRILELYAATEVQAVTMISGEDWRTHRGSVGRAVVGELVVLDRDGRQVPPGEVGEVWMRRGPDDPGPYRYIGAEPKGRAGGWESVGDMGWLDADGYLYLADRQTDMILIGGANVYPAKVEAALEAHPAIRSACVVGLPDEDLGSVPHAIVQSTVPVPDDELRAFLSERLSRFKVPRSFERVEEPLRDDAGKVRRSALRDARIPVRDTSKPAP
jgi:bile acid-coenzyme A ligase